MRAGIVGTGLVGSSLGMALTRAGADALLEDLNFSHTRIAAGLGARWMVTDSEPVNTIMVVLPPAVIAGVATWMLEHHSEAVIIDIRSVRSSIIRVMMAASDRPERCIPGRPMVDSQLTGSLTTLADLFTDRTWVITPQASSGPEDVSLVRRLTCLCGARMVELDVDLHDEAVTQVSRVPHLINILTASHLRGVPGGNLILAGQGIRDVTRIAGSDPGLWRQIITANSVAIRRELNEVAADLEYLIEVLDQAGLLEAFSALGQHGVITLRGKHGQAPKELATVTVEVPDEPHVLTRLPGNVGSFGFNVEDFELTHDIVREVGYLSISIERPQAERSREDLELHDWRTRLDREGI